MFTYTPYKDVLLHIKIFFKVCNFILLVLSIIFLSTCFAIIKSAKRKSGYAGQPQGQKKSEKTKINYKSQEKWRFLKKKVRKSYEVGKKLKKCQVLSV